MPPDVKPTAARIVLYLPKEPKSKPWPAIVVDVRQGPKGDTLCDLQPFPTRGHGPQALLLDVVFVSTPGAPGSCYYPPRLEAVPPAPPDVDK